MNRCACEDKRHEDADGTSSRDLGRRKDRAFRLKTWMQEQIDATTERAAAVAALVARMALEQQIVALRRARGLTQQQVAQEAGVSQAWVGRLESGRGQNIGVHTLTRLVLAMGGQIQITINAETRWPIDVAPPIRIRTRQGRRRIEGTRVSR